MVCIGTRQHCVGWAWWESARRIFIVIISIITNQIPEPITACTSGFNIPPISDRGGDHVPPGYIVLVTEKGEGVFCLQELSTEAKLVENDKETPGIHSFELGQKGIGALLGAVDRAFMDPFQEFRGWLGGGRQRRGA